MKNVNDCIAENCIPTPSSCIDWNGGDIDSLGICNGDPLNNITIEIINKLESLAGEDLSKFDINGLLDICSVKAPLEITLINILTVIKDNHICLKDYIDTLFELVNDLSKEQSINVDLHCLASLDNLGNQLAMTRETLDQLVVNEICDAKSRLNTIEGKIILIAAEVANIDPHATVDELSFSTCIDGGIKPTSSQVIKIADSLCALQTATGTPANIAQSLSKTPAGWNTKFGLISGWDLTPDNWAQAYGNALLVISNLESRLSDIETNCCAITCDDVKIGFSVLWSDDKTSVILKFSPGSGTKLPTGIVDKGSTGTITDQNGNIVSFTVPISVNHEEEVYITGLDTSGQLNINIDARLGNDSITCDKCLNKLITNSMGCAYCEITATGDDTASAVLVYRTMINSGSVETSTSTTTTVL